MRRVLVFSYGFITYLLFLGTFLYSIGFFGDLFVPKTIDSPASGASTLTAVLINLGLLSVFAVQHSVMARPAFKSWWTRFVPEVAERSTYVLATVAALVLLYWGWQPIAGSVWSTDPGSAAHTILTALFFVGWGLVLYSTILISHFDLFGLRQVWLYARGIEYFHLPFGTPSLYKYIRHPLYVGWFMVFWVTPVMSPGHLLMAAVSTAYILVAVFGLEERDLLKHFPGHYARYKEQVPAFIPLPGRRASASDSAVAAAR